MSRADRREINARYRANHAEQLRVSRAAYYAANREKCLGMIAAWREANPEKRKEESRRAAELRRTCPHRNLQHRMRNGIRRSLLTGKAGRTTEALLGYPYADLRAHMERQFLKGMSWENMGEWHIDHIIPLSSFTIAGPECPEFKRAWGLANLRPMWASANMSKGSKRTVLL